MNLSIEFFPLIPTAALWLALSCIIVVSVLLIASGARGTFLRIACLLLFIFALTNPHLKREIRTPLKNIALVVVDESYSQSIANRPEILSHVKNKLGASLKGLKNLEIRWVYVKNSKQKSSNSGTTMFSTLKNNLATIPQNLLAGVFLITDGQVHDIPKNTQDLNVPVPIHTLVTGSKKEIDQRIEVIKAPRFGLVGSKSNIQIRVTRSNNDAFPNNVATVNIYKEGQKIKRQRVPAGTIFNVPIDFPHAGPNFIEFELERSKNEITAANNRVAVMAQGVRENLRVLLISGEPHIGERTWRNLLKSDASVDLVHFTILRPPDKQDGTPVKQLSLIGFPTRELFSEKLNEFDLIIFDQYRRRGVLPLLYLDNISRYVEQGGAILVAAGTTYATPLSLYSTPLSQILPAAPTGRIIKHPFKAQVTDLGKRHPVTRNLPGDRIKDPNWGRWFRLIQVQPRLGKVLMNGHDENPLLVLNRIGKGRVALLLSDHAWLWARGFEGGGPYNTLLRRLAHWLMKEPDLEEEYLKANIVGNQLVLERRSMRDGIEPVEMQSPNGEKRKVALEKVTSGVWRQTTKLDEIGLYRFKSGNLFAVAHSGQINSLEMSDVVATQKDLEPVTKQTGGGFFWLNPTGNVSKSLKSEDISMPKITMVSSGRIMHGNGWMALKKRNAYRVQGVVYVPLFVGLLALCLIAGLIILTWFWEGRTSRKI